jgi:hypothetical protein
MNRKTTRQILSSILLCLSGLLAFGQTVQLGSGTSINGTQSASPINIYFRSMRMQIVYTRAELNAAGIAAGSLTDLGFYVTGVPTHSLPNFKIAIAHTTSDSASADLTITGDFSQAYTNASYTPTAGGYDMLSLDSAFYWNGTDNIVLDVCFDRVPGFTSTGQLRVYADNSVGYARSDGANQCGVTLDETTLQKPQIQMTFIPPIADNAGVVGSNISGRVCAGSQPVTADVQNFGNNQISSLDVNWEVNGVAQTPVSFAGTLDTAFGSGNQSTQISLGNFNFIDGVTYSLKVWSSLPNGNADAFATDDTLYINNVTVGMGGTYTIGGASPDYASFTLAISDLQSKGVCDAVIFNVADGSYFEQLSINNIAGTSSANTVTFKGASGDSSLAKLSFASSSFSDNYTLYIDSTEYLSFEDLTIEATGSTYDRVLFIEDETHHLTIENCALENNAVSTPNGYELVRLESGANSDYVSFSNTRFFQGEEAFISFGSEAQHLSFTGNTFINQRDDGLVVDNADYLTIEDNYLNTNSTITFDGFDIESCDSAISIQRNQLINMRGGRGIYFSFSEASMANPAIIANNFIHQIASSTSAEAIYINGCDYVDVYHNTVNVASSDANTYGIYVDGYDGISLLNNNVGMQGSTPVYVSSDADIDSSSHNNWYTTGNRLANWDGNNYTNLNDLQNAFSKDENSISLPSYFANDTSFVSSQVGLNNSGASLANITVDIEGETRDASNPDIGADEFTPTGIDAGLFTIVYPETPFAQANLPVKAVVQNFGGTTITSATINWELNGVAQVAANFNGSLATGDTASVLLGNVNFTAGTVYRIKAFSSLPNGGADALAINDTVESPDFTPSLSGTYTIGGASPDFADFTSATTALNLGGTVGNVIFNVRDGNYSERIKINRFLQSDTTHTITYRSENGDSSLVNLTAGYTSINENYIIWVNGAHNLRFEDLHIENLSTNSYSRVIHLDSGASNIQFLRSALIAGPTTSSATSVIYAYNSDFNDPNINTVLVDSCTLENGYYGIYKFGRNGRDKGFSVRNSEIKDFYRYGLYSYNQDSLTIHNNVMMSRSNATSSGEVIYLYTSLKGSITSNTLLGTNINEGVFAQRLEGTASEPFLVANNFIVSGGTSSSGKTFELYEVHQVKVVHNNMLSLNTHSSSTVFNDDYDFYNSNIGVEVLNNNFRHAANGYAITADHSNTTTSFDYNNLTTSGLNLANWSFTDQADLAAWQAASGQAVNSLSIDPQYESDTDLHVSASGLNKAALLLSYISTDIDGEVRDATNPDIGADEFSLPADDAALLAFTGPLKPFTPGNQNVYIRLLNNGADTLNTLTINWSVNGAAQTPFAFSGALPSGEVLDSVNIGTFNFLNGVNYGLEAIAASPNGNADALPENDTTTISNLFSALAGTYTVGGVTPDFTDFNAAALALKQRGISDNVIFNVRDGVYNEIVEVKEICGTSATDSIIFQSESGNASAVSLESNSNSDEILTLTGTDYISFKDMTIQSKYVFSGQGIIEIDSMANHVNFIGVVIKDSINGTNGDVLVNNGATYNNNSLHFMDCSFIGGRYAMELRGRSSSDLESDLRIINCDFDDQYYRAVYALYQDTPVFTKDSISSNRGYTFFEGFDLSTFRNGGLISQNYIIDVTGYGIYALDVDGTTMSPALITNNYVQMVGSNSSSSGILISSCNFNNVSHNTVRSFNSSTSSENFRETSCANIEVQNNIFQNEGAGYAMELNGYSSLAEDHNNLYAAGATLVRYRFSNYSDLATYQATSSQSTNSLSVLSQFVDSLSVNVQAATLDGAGTPLSYVTVDFEDQGRDPANPDIGADEYSINTEDASITAITSPTKPFPAGINDVYVSLLNNGLDTLRTLNIEWEVNGTAQTTFAWTGALGTGNTEDSVLIGNFNFVAGTQYSIQVNSSLPNAQADIQTNNDTTEVNNLYAALSGVYVVGSSTGNDFITLNEAVTAMDNGGVIDFVRFDLQTQSFNEQVSIPEISFSSINDSVVFQAQSGSAADAVITFDATFGANYLFELDGVDRVTFQNLTFEPTNNTYAFGIDMQSTTDTVRVQNCVFNLPTTASASARAINADDVNKLEVMNNTFKEGYAGFYADGVNTTGLVIDGNIFRNQDEYGVYAGDFDAPSIQNNTVRASNSNTAYHGFYLFDFDNDFVILKNDIYVPYLGDAFFGSDLDGIGASRGLIANNFFSIGDSTASTSSTDAFYLSSSALVDVVYNSMHHASANGRAVYWTSNSSTAIFQNNIAAATNGGYAFERNGSTLNLDYNNYFSSGANTFRNNGVNLTDLAAWQSAISQDASSLSVDPLFSSASDLHIGNVQLDSSGVVFATVTDDIDGDARNTVKTDIGADEVSFFTGDIRIASLVSPMSDCALDTNESITIEVANNSSTPLSNFDVTVVIGNDSLTETIVASIGASSSINYTFTSGTFDLSAVGIYNLTAYSSLAGDSNPLNDTLVDVIQNFPPPVVSLTNDTNICEGNAVTLVASGGVNYLWSNGLMTQSITVGPTLTTEYKVSITDGNGCTVEDSVTVFVNNQRDTTTINLTSCNPADTGTFTQNLINQLGCDSIVVTVTDLLPSFQTTLPNVTICEGDVASIFGQNRMLAGIYTNTLIAQNGCDSVLSQELVLLPIDSVSLPTQTICQGNTSFIIDDFRGVSGVYNKTFNGSNGCDSVVTQELIVLPTDSTQLADVVICQGDTAQIFGVDRTMSGTYHQTLVGSNSCDSIVSIELIVNPVYSIVLNESICEGQTYVFNGNAETTTGVYFNTFQTGEGCDSTVVVNLTVNTIDSTSETQQVAIGDSVQLGGVWRSVSGTYPVTFTGSNNCDSVHTTVLNFVPPARYFTFTGNANFQNSMVFPLTGDQYTTFDFQVTYFDTNGVLPPYGYPRTILDFEGNGSFNNTKDRTIVMAEADPNDLDPTDGKVYTASINSLEVGMNYELLAQVVENQQEVRFGPFDVPDVLQEPDLEIFANDIVYSKTNPDTSEVITLTATIHNTSDYDASNFVVHLESQYDPARVFPDITVPSLSARSSTTVSWTFAAPSVPAWVPMEVFVDWTNVITESNELDNDAIRPYIVGDFNVPGAIVVHPEPSPNKQCSTPNSFIRISGYAYYTQTAVPLQDSSVAGATVTLDRGGATYTGLTNSRGYFNISIPAPLAVGNYPTNVEVTDFTLTGDSTTSFEILNCPCTVPDLAAYLQLTDYSILAGESIDGFARIRNVGCDTAIAHIMSFTQTGGVPLLMNQNMPSLAPGEEQIYNFSNIVFNNPGTYSICVYADDARTVGETNFGNNTYCRTIRVYPALPDIQPVAGPITDRFLCNASSPSFVVRNNGAVATGSFENTIYVRLNGIIIDTLYRTIPNIDAFRNYSFTTNFVYPSVGTYSFNIQCDTNVVLGGDVVETNETNNTATYVHNILECKPDLTVLTCGQLEIDGFDITAPGGNATFQAVVRNNGNATAFGPIDVDFVVSNGGPTYTVTIGDLTPGQQLTVQTPALTVASASATLTARIDPANVINNEFSESNNAYSDRMCWEYQPVPRCGFGDFWNRTYNVNETAFLSVAVDVDHLYKADSVEVKFEVSGPGIPGTVNLGNALMTNVQTTCSCPRVAVLPNNFVFNEAGVYTFTMTVDPDNDYAECDENNNVLIRQVTVLNRPDMRVLSQFINPSLLNPGVNDSVSIVVSYENIGKANINDQMELKLLIDGMPYDSIKPVVGLATGDNTSYTMNYKWASNIPGAHIIRAIIDSDEEITENNELNNEATRAIIVGDAANLLWASFISSDLKPNLGDTITISGEVTNNGDIATDADVTLAYVNNNNDTIVFATIPLPELQPDDTVSVSDSWIVLDERTTLVGEIVNASEIEFTYFDNVTTTQIGKFDVSLIANGACFGDTGNIKAVVSGDGVPPYSFQWSSGEVTDSIGATPGQYTLDVTDATGFTVTTTGVVPLISGGLQYLSNINICAGDSIEVFGTFQTVQGFYYDTLQNVTGCDSVLARALIVSQPQTRTNPLLQYCGLDSVQVFGVWRNMSGTYYDSLVSNNGCDSIIAQTIELNQPQSITLSAISACDSVEVFGQYVLNSGIYRDTLTGLNGCDSIVSVSVSINTEDRITETVTACGSYTWPVNGSTYTAGDTYVASFTNQAGCDSIHFLQLTINDADSVYSQITACDSYTWVGGIELISSGRYMDTLNNAAGCDSVLVLDLTINDSFDSVMTVTNCGDYTWPINNFPYSSSGVFTETFVRANGCDSVYTLNLTINNPTFGTENITACDTYQWLANGMSYNSSGSYTAMLTDQNGCDSLVTLNLTVNASDTLRDTAIACDTYTWPVNSMAYTSSGIYTQIRTNASGCDSVLVLNLTINQSSDTTNLMATACDQYIWFPSNEAGSAFFIYNQSGTYFHTLQNQLGCDSVLELDLIINTSDSTVESATACDRYLWAANGVTYDDGGVYFTTLTNGAGCDSVVRLNLTLNSSDTISDTVTACDSYTWAANGMMYTSSGNYSATFTNQLGCDSIMQLNLTINNSDSTGISVTACDSYSWSPNGGTPFDYNTSGLYSVTLTNTAGCDSVVSLDLTINNSDSTVESATACDSYVWAANGVTYDDGGVYFTTLTNGAGCDSVIRLNLTLNLNDTISDTVIACDSYTWAANGMMYTSSGNYSATFTNQLGCDSIMQLNLTINSSDSTTVPVTACDFYDWSPNGGTPVRYSASGNYVTTLQNVSGCDSVVSLSLIINTSDTVSQTASACDSYTWPANGTTYSMSGNYSSTLTNVNGCDSVINLALTIYGNDSTGVQQTACESYTWIQTGITYTMSGLYADTLTNTNGCDSIITLDLTINQADTLTQSVSACDIYTWSVDGNSYSTSGMYSVSLLNQVGCDSVVILDLTVNYSSHGSETATACNRYTWPFNGQTYTMSGTYNDTINGSNGCDSSMTLNLTINTVDATVTLNNFILTAQATGTNVTYQWGDCNNGFQAIAGETNQTFAPVANGDYAVVVSDNGCTDTSACISVQGIGLDGLQTISGIELYPNPTLSGDFHLDLGRTYGKVEILVKDMSGKIIQRHTLNGVDHFDGHLEAARGIYFIDIYVDDIGHEVRRLNKQ